MSMKPGATAQPDASSSRSPRSFGPISRITPPVIATSAARPGAPLPSKTVPPRMTNSAGIWTDTRARGHDLFELLDRTAGGHPTIYRQHDPRDLRRPFARQIQDGIRHVSGLPLAVQRLRGTPDLSQVVG